METPYVNKTPPGSDRGTTGALPTKRAFSPDIDDGFCQYSQALIPFGPRKRDRLNIRTSRFGNARRGGRPDEIDVIKEGEKNGDDYQATWWRDAKLMRIPRTDLPI